MVSLEARREVGSEEERNEGQKEEMREKRNAPCHHLPELSRTSRISPLANEISLGSSGEAESVRREINKRQHRKSEKPRTHKSTTPSP